MEALVENRFGGRILTTRERTFLISPLAGQPRN